MTLNQPFSRHSGSEEIMDALFMAGVVSDNSRLGGGKLKAWDGNITNWQELQWTFDDAPDGMTIRLTQDISAIQGVDSKLNLAEGKDVILDLNGYTLSRALTDCSPEEDGHVITNFGTLTITDSSADHSGKITGGNSIDQCGAIWNWSTLTLEGVTVSGNCAGLKAGAIWNWGTLTLDGAEISGNTSGAEGGGIFNIIRRTALYTLSGPMHRTRARADQRRKCVLWRRHWTATVRRRRSISGMAITAAFLRMPR